MGSSSLMPSGRLFPQWTVAPPTKMPPLTLTPTHPQGSLLGTQPSIDHGMDASDASQLSTLGNGGTETERSLPPYTLRLVGTNSLFPCPSTFLSALKPKHALRLHAPTSTRSVTCNRVSNGSPTCPMLVAIETTKSPICIYWALIISAQDRVIRRPLLVALRRPQHPLTTTRLFSSLL